MLDMIPVAAADAITLTNVPLSWTASENGMGSVMAGTSLRVLPAVEPVANELRKNAEVLMIATKVDPAALRHGVDAPAQKRRPAVVQAEVCAHFLQRLATRVGDGHLHPRDIRIDHGDSRRDRAGRRP